MKNPNIAYVTNTEDRRRTRNSLLFDGCWPVLEGLKPSSIIAHWGMKHYNGPGLFDNYISRGANWHYLETSIHGTCTWVPVWIYLLACSHFPEQPLKVFLPFRERFKLTEMEEMREDYRRIYTAPKEIMLLLTEYQLKYRGTLQLDTVSKQYLDLAVSNTHALVSRKI